jgi:hypothetical protein
MRNVSDLLEPCHGATGCSAEHGKQSFHQSHSTCYANTVDDRHFPILVSFRVEEDTPLPGRKSLLHFQTFLLYILEFGKKKLLIFFLLSISRG